MSKMPSTSLPPAQREIMEIVWDKGEVAAIEVRDIIAERRPVARETVRTILQRMEAKGWVKHRVVGRTHFYSAAMPREATVGHKVVELIDTICGGSPERLVTALLDFRGLSKAESERIQQLIENAKKKKPTSPPSEAIPNG